MENDCPVCYESLINCNRIVTHCNHNICYSCFKKIICNQNICPICRSKLENENLNEATTTRENVLNNLVEILLDVNDITRFTRQTTMSESLHDNSYNTMINTISNININQSSNNNHWVYSSNFIPITRGHFMNNLLNNNANNL